jgi:hypothetical protein
MEEDTWALTARLVEAVGDFPSFPQMFQILTAGAFAVILHLD